MPTERENMFAGELYNASDPEVKTEQVRTLEE
jgi:hypothetical protein